MGNPFAQELASRQQASADAPPDSSTASPAPATPSNPFAAELNKRQALGGLDFSKPVEQVRADIGQLPPEYKDDALNQWAKAYVAKENAQGGVGQMADNTVRTLARGTFAGPWLDEANAAIKSGQHALGMGGSPYDESLAYERARDRYVDEKYPVASTVGKIAGGITGAVGAAATAGPGLALNAARVAAGGPLASITPAASVPGRIAQSSGVGAVYGANAGAGEAEGGVGERLEGGLRGVAAGAVVGGALGGVGEVAHRVLAQRAAAAQTARYFNSATGELTPEGQAAAKSMNVDPAQMMASARETFAKTYASSPQDAQAMVGAGTLDFDIPQTLGQRTKDPQQLMAEKAMRAGLNGDSAKNVITSLDADQASKVASAVRETIPARMMEPGSNGLPFRTLDPTVPLSSESAGQAITNGLQTTRTAARGQETAAWEGIGKLTPTPEALGDLMPSVQAGLGHMEADDQLHPVSSRILQLLQDYAEGKPVGKINPNPDLDTMRRRLLDYTKAAANPSDSAIASRLYGSFNDWMGSVAERKLVSGNPEDAARILNARDVTRTMRGLFAPTDLGRMTPGGKILRDVLNQDTPENVVNTLFTSPKAGIKNGSIEALGNIRQALARYGDQDTASQTWSALKIAYWSKLVQGKDGELLSPTMQLGNIRAALNNQRSLMGELYHPSDMDLMRRYAAQLEQITWKDPNPSGTATGLASLTKQMFGTVLNALGPVGKSAFNWSGVPEAYGKMVAQKAVQQTAPKIPAQAIQSSGLMTPAISSLSQVTGMGLAPKPGHGMGLTSPQGR